MAKLPEKIKSKVLKWLKGNYDESVTATAAYTGKIRLWLEKEHFIGKDHYDGRALKDVVRNYIGKEVKTPSPKKNKSGEGAHRGALSISKASKSIKK